MRHESRDGRGDPNARGPAKVDVYATDVRLQPHLNYICECKLWVRNVSKDKVHTLRSVVQDAGAHVGLLISNGGFQSGAYEAAARTNLVLVTWAELNAKFIDQWFLDWMLPRLAECGRALTEYTDEYGSRVITATSRLEATKRQAVMYLQDKHRALGALMAAFGAAAWDQTLIDTRGLVERLPLMKELSGRVRQERYLRPLVDALCSDSVAATQEFEQAFGGLI